MLTHEKLVEMISRSNEKESCPGEWHGWHCIHNCTCDECVERLVTEYENSIRADAREKFAELIANTCSVCSEDYPFGMSAKTLIYEYEHQMKGNARNDF